MNSHDFDPGNVGVPNGQFFGFPYTLEEAQIAFLPICWDVTTSYGDGTSRGPLKMIDASVQLDFFDPSAPEAWTYGHATLEPDLDLLNENDLLREKAKVIIEALEQGKSPLHPTLAEHYEAINKGTSKMVDYVYNKTCELMDEGLLVGLVGGDHSTPLGYMKAIDERYESWGILQIDAHADLRIAYEGFKHSHASIMYNALQETSVDSIVQIGVRDLSPDEFDLTQNDFRIECFLDHVLKRQQFQGRSWESLCHEMISLMPSHVYVSFDIDGLDPSLCPNTGTPVPGGLNFDQAIFLIEALVLSGREIIGFDLVEVAEGEKTDWNANVGARLLYRMSNLAYMSRQINQIG